MAQVNDEPVEDQNDDQEDPLYYASQKEAILFVIDVSESMLEGISDGNSVRSALTCAYHLLTQKIIATPNDMVGVLLYGTSQTESPSTYGHASCKNVTLLIDLECPDALSMRRLKKAVHDDKFFAKTCAPSSERPTLTNVLFLCNSIFNQHASNFNYKRIVLISDEDDPHADNKVVRQASITRARDLNDLGIKIEPIFLSKSGRSFDCRKFYDDIIFRDEDDDDEQDIVEAGEQRMKQMMSRIRTKVSTKRAIFSIPLEIAPSVKIGIKGYVLYKEQKISKSAYVYNQGEAPQFAKVESSNLCYDTSKTLQKMEVRKGYKFGDERILFDETELKDIKFVEDPVLRIIGYKSFDKLHAWHNMRASYFIYPSESTVVGSTRVFAALHRNLLSKKKWALAWFIPRKNSNPVLVAMIAANSTVLEGQQVSPSGTHLITLPCADDIRQDPMVKMVRAPTDLVESLSEILCSLQMATFDPYKYHNPALQRHWAILQAMALEEDMPGPLPDTSLPKYKGIDKRVGSKINDWQDLLQNTLHEMEQVTIASHKRGQTEDVPPVKKQKVESDDVKLAAENNQLAKCSVASLKAYIKENDLKGKPASQKKADLVEFIADALS